MTAADHNLFREWVYLEPDGRLTRAERSRLAAHLEACPGCRELRRQAAGLDRLLTGARVGVEPGFGERVLGSLPHAGWEARAPRGWLAAVGLLALLAIAAAAAARLGAAGGEGLGAPPLVAALVAVLDLFRATALAGAGLLGASWQGVGSALGEALAASPAGFVAFGLLVAALDVLFVRFLLRTMRGAARTEAPPSRRSGRRGAPR